MLKKTAILPLQKPDHNATNVLRRPAKEDELGHHGGLMPRIQKMVVLGSSQFNKRPRIQGLKVEHH